MPQQPFTLALELAAQAIGLCQPNPRVGCVITAADGRVIGCGHTQQRGGPHAEIMALRDAQSRGESTAGSTVHVSLEPCAHHGRTPPCCDALIAARVARVVVALQDPNPLVAGKGIGRLRAAGIAVEMAAPDVAQAARAINIGFLHRMESGLPWVRLKTASSLDGFTALPDGRSQWITGQAARDDVQHWRARACTILTGVGTVLADDPLLNLRLPHAAHQPRLAVLDSHLRTPPTARLFGVAQRPVCLYTLADDDSAAARALRAAGADILTLPAGSDGRPCLHALLRDLAQRESNEIHVEAGATLGGALLQAGLVDEVLAYIAPVLLGQGLPLARIAAPRQLDQAQRWHLHDIQPLGADLRLRLRRAAQTPCLHG